MIVVMGWAILYHVCDPNSKKTSEDWAEEKPYFPNSFDKSNILPGHRRRLTF